MSKLKTLLILSLVISTTLFAQSNSKVQYLTASDFKRALDTGKYILIDVRTPDEFSQGHIAGAVNINFYDNSFSAKMKAITAKNKAIAVYCRSGSRSKAAIANFESKSTQIVDLKDGISSWQQSGYKLSTAK